MQANNDVNSGSVLDTFNFIELIYYQLISLASSGPIGEDTRRDLMLAADPLGRIINRTGEYNPLVWPGSHDQHDYFLRQQVKDFDEIMQPDFGEEAYSILPALLVPYDVEPPCPESDNVQSNAGSPSGTDQGPPTPRSPGEKGLNCCLFPGCQKSFKYLSKLKDHMRKHEPASIQCPECRQMFKQERILKKHMYRIHKADGGHGVKGTRSQASSVRGQEQMQADHPQVQQCPDTSAAAPLGWKNSVQDVGLDGTILMERSSSIDHCFDLFIRGDFL